MAVLLGEWGEISVYVYRWNEKLVIRRFPKETAMNIINNLVINNLVRIN